MVFGTNRTRWVTVPYGLPQGSVLAPLLFVLYTSDLGAVFQGFGVCSHQFADDTQALLHGPASSAVQMVESLLEASSALEAWLSSNRLRLNPDKTQFIWLGGRLQLDKIDTDSLHNRYPLIQFSSSVRDLGIILDPTLSFMQQANSVSRSCFYHLRQLRSIRSSLSTHAITILVHALICTRVDFGNAVYIGLSASNTYKFQSILNAAARLIGGIPKFAHISGFIRDTLHWLPIQQRVQFKTLSLMRNCIAGVAPAYLRSFCTLVSSIPSRVSLRSSTCELLVVPRMRSATAHSRCFARVGPAIWNSLPHCLRLELLALSPAQFRRRLKTYLFTD